MFVLQRTYARLGVEVQPLRIRQEDLNTKRMLDLMAVSHNDGPMPLYIHTVYRILRDMRLAQQETGLGFNYAEFKRQLDYTPMTPAQLGPLNQRLDTLESFMPSDETKILGKEKKDTLDKSGTDWASKVHNSLPMSCLLNLLVQAGRLTIVDLSCPCVTPEGACSLFNICLSIFLEHKSAAAGRIIALDEAHKVCKGITYPPRYYA